MGSERKDRQEGRKDKPLGFHPEGRVLRADQEPTVVGTPAENAGRQEDSEGDD